MQRGHIKIPQDKIADFCRQRKITELALFGSALRDDFRPSSDIDILITFAPDSHYSFFDLVSIKEDLEHLFGREVDLVEKAALRNPFRRHGILQNAEIIYAA